MSLLEIGYAVGDITPAPGITLSGFAARCNCPSVAVGDALQVSALVFNCGGEKALVMVFDLLGMGPDLTEAVQQSLDGDRRCPIAREHRFFFCTHTHSAPATITLLGCGRPVPEYWAQLAKSAADVAAAAWLRRTPARWRLATEVICGACHNRRNLLADGRVVMALRSGMHVEKSGPVAEDLSLLCFETPDGEPLVLLAHWAAHPDTICTLDISADYPGELRRRLAERMGCPCLFIQGAAGNLNPPFQNMTRGEMLENVDQMMRSLGAFCWSDPLPVAPFAVETFNIPLEYDPPPPRGELERFRDGMERIAKTGAGPDDIIGELMNILNIEPGASADPAMLRYIAGCMRDWAALVLASSPAPRTCDLSLAVLRLGPLALCGVAAEVFIETALTLQAEAPGDHVLVAGYLSPLTGYLPTDAARREGGYEVDFAYRFYAHPSPFAAGSEPAVRSALRAAIRRTKKSNSLA